MTKPVREVIGSAYRVPLADNCRKLIAGSVVFHIHVTPVSRWYTTTERLDAAVLTVDFGNHRTGGVVATDESSADSVQGRVGGTECQAPNEAVSALVLESQV